MTHLKIYNASIYAGISIVLYTFMLIGIMNCLRPHVLNRPYAWVKLSAIQSVTNFIGICVGIILLGWYDCEYTDRDEPGVIPVRHLALLVIIFSLIATLRVYNIFLCRSIAEIFGRRDQPTPTSVEQVAVHM
tara:strand:- start:75 stop:470 length:396 start_codon:yes stop_codon:yes gene_type:complete